MGAAKYALHPIGAMQYYWFYKIVSMLRTRYESKDSKKVGKVTDDNDLSKEIESSTVGKKDD